MWAGKANDSTPKMVATQVGDVDLAVPRDRDASRFPNGAVPSATAENDLSTFRPSQDSGVCPAVRDSPVPHHPGYLRWPVLSGALATAHGRACAGQLPRRS